MKRALIFSPYFDIMGGGEAYSLNFAECIQKTYQVSLAWENPDVFKKANDFFGIKLDSELLDPKAYAFLMNKGMLLSKYKYFKDFDLIFFVSDGSLPLLSGKKNIVHFQVPFTKLNRHLVNFLKLQRIHHIICNSDFTKSVIDKRLKVNSKTIYPPVSLQPSKAKKENIILSVARFSDSLTNKNQDVMVEAFNSLAKNIHGWKLILAGSSHSAEGKRIVSSLKKKIKNNHIEIRTNISFDEIVNLYSQAKIFWHAAGYDIDEKNKPELVEHFGISTVEAMTAGCVPVVINKGGLKETVQDGSNGYLFENKNELISKTQKLISQPKLLSRLSESAKHSSKKFSKQAFCRSVQSLL